MPRTPLVTFQEKVSPEMVSKDGLGLWAVLWATATSLTPVLSVPSLRCQDAIPTGLLNTTAAPAMAWPQVHGHRHDCSEEVTAHRSQDQPDPQRGHTTDTPYPVAHVSDKLKRQHIS